MGTVISYNIGRTLEGGINNVGTHSTASAALQQGRCRGRRRWGRPVTLVQLRSVKYVWLWNKCSVESADAERDRDGKVRHGAQRFPLCPVRLPVREWSLTHGALALPCGQHSYCTQPIDTPLSFILAVSILCMTVSRPKDGGSDINLTMTIHSGSIPFRLKKGGEMLNTQINVIQRDGALGHWTLSTFTEIKTSRRQPNQWLSPCDIACVRHMTWGGRLVRFRQQNNQSQHQVHQEMSATQDQIISEVKLKVKKRKNVHIHFGFLMGCKLTTTTIFKCWIGGGVMHFCEPPANSSQLDGLSSIIFLYSHLISGSKMIHQSGAYLHSADHCHVVPEACSSC